MDHFSSTRVFTNLEQRLRVTLKMVYHSGLIHFCKPHGNDQNEVRLDQRV